MDVWQDILDNLKKVSEIKETVSECKEGGNPLGSGELLK